jgi:hypothetical protein
MAKFSQVTEQNAISLRSELSSFFTSLQAKAAAERAFPASQPFYDDYAGRLNAFLTSENLKKKNQQTVQELQNIIAALGIWRTQHQAAVPSPAAIAIVRQQFESSWESVITLERAKPR